MHTFSKNLKRLRLAKGLTQEQSAESLGVSTQSVSRWECGTTLPDVAMLPRIARLYCVSIDDLYKEDCVAYENYAQRLGSIYEATRNMDDFLRADREYRKLLQENAATGEDLRMYGVLYQYAMEDCRGKALALFDRAMSQEKDGETFWRTKRQKLYLLSLAGRGEEAIASQLEAVKSGDLNEIICLIAAYENAGRWQEAKGWMEKALANHPDDPALLIYCGNVYRSLERFEDAFRCWEKAFRVDPSYLDALYAMGFCYEELGKFDRAYEVWCQLTGILERRGFEAELTLPQTQAKKCLEAMGKSTAGA